MLTHRQIQKVARLQYQVETEIYGTLFGQPLGGAPHCCYGPRSFDKPLPTDNKREDSKGDLEEGLE